MAKLSSKKANPKISYIRLDFGRYAGRVTSRRWLKIDVMGKVVYVERREPNLKEYPDSNHSVHWKIGTIKLLGPYAKAIASNKREFDSSLKEALQHIL